MVVLCPVVGEGDGITNSFACGHIAVFANIENIRQGTIEERIYDDG